MNRFNTLLLFLRFVVLTSYQSDSRDDITETIAGDTPNIILIIADDRGLDATPGFTEGNVKPSMSNLESLIASELHSQGNIASDQTSIDANPAPYYMAAIEAMVIRLVIQSEMKLIN